MDCRIYLKGHLDSSWQEWLAGLTILHQDSGTTLLTGSLPDQAALHGVLVTLRRLNLSLLSLETDEEPRHGEDRSRERLTRDVVQPQTERAPVSMNTDAHTNHSPFTTDSVISADGTTIGYRTCGQGPALIMLHGANTSSLDFTQLALPLTDRFTVYLPDRRGRGLSGPFSSHYRAQEEVEDLTALVNKTGARLLYGVSGGGIICLQASLNLPAIQKIALYEPALLLDGAAHTSWLPRFDQEMTEGKVAAALVTSMKGLELGGPVMNAMPNWLLESLTNSAMKGEDRKAGPEDITMRKLAPTIHYDGLLIAEMSGQLERFREVKAEVLLLGGSKGLPFLKPALAALEQTLPHVAGRVEFPGLDHGGSNNPSQTNRGSKPELVAQELRQFFTRP